MPRGPIYLINERYNPYKHSYYNESNEHQHRNERRRVLTPPLHSGLSHLVSDNFHRYQRVSKRSRSRSPYESKKICSLYNQSNFFYLFLH